MSEEIEMRKAAYDLKQKESLSVNIVRFDMPFIDMVFFMVKWAIASIPAAIILVIIGSILAAVVAGLKM